MPQWVCVLIVSQYVLISFYGVWLTLVVQSLQPANVIAGVYKAMKCRFFDFSNFNIEEYEYYEAVDHGRLCVIGSETGLFTFFLSTQAISTSSFLGDF
jgi:hypothetical protein